MNKSFTEIRVITPVGCIGNRGVDRDAFRAAVVADRPHVIAVDAGTLDCGPWYLGAGQAHSPLLNIEWDIEAILGEAIPRKIPVIIGSAGGSGAAKHVDNTVEIVRRLASEMGLRFRMAVIYADIAKEMLLDMARDGVIASTASMKDGSPLQTEDVRSSDVIVAAMGPEPMVDALHAGADVVLAGRAVDAAVIAAFPIAYGFDRGLAYHMGDIMECAETAAEEVQPTLRAIGHNRIPIIGTIRRNDFLLKPARQTMACTPLSCLMHSLYERSNVESFRVPGGLIDRKDTKYEAFDALTTRVWGTRLVEESYSVVLEGVKRTGYRSLFLFGVRTPLMIDRLDEILHDVEQIENALYGGSGTFRIHWHKYGANAVLQAAEPQGHAHEIGVIADVVAETQALAHDIAYEMFTRIAFWRYPGRYTTAGNIAVTFSPGVFDGGEVFEFSIYHTLKTDDYRRLFRTEMIDVGAGT